MDTANISVVARPRAVVVADDGVTQVVEIRPQGLAERLSRKRGHKLEMFEIAEELGMTLEEFVGPKRACLYPRNIREVEFLGALKKLTPLQQAVINAMLVGSALGYLDDPIAKAITNAADPLAAALKWCDALTPRQRAAMEAHASDRDARFAHELAEAHGAMESAV